MEVAVPMASVPVIPAIRRRAIMEVIDVDSIDELDLRRSQRPSQRWRLLERPDGTPSRMPASETIMIIDSDDEQDTGVQHHRGSFIV